MIGNPEMKITHYYPSRVWRIGCILPRYQVFIPDQPYTGFGYTVVVWGYSRAWRRAWGGTS
jgi:hypothetical protein